MEDPVVKDAQCAFSTRLKNSSSVSEHTRDAQAIGKTWQLKVIKRNRNRYQREQQVPAGLHEKTPREKIDIIDMEKGIAYEFNVSGKSARDEFYKDIVKVILWNKNHEKKLLKLVFITDGVHGRKLLEKPMPKAYIDHLKSEGLIVKVAYVNHN
jgi:hypothetical protein